MQGVIVEFNTPPLAYLKYEKMIRIYIYKTEMRVVFVWGVAYGKYVWSASVGWVGNNFPRRTWRRDQEDGSTLVTTRHTCVHAKQHLLKVSSFPGGTFWWRVRIHALRARCWVREVMSCNAGPLKEGVCAERRSTRTGIQTSTSILGPSDVGPTVQKQKQNITTTLFSLSLSPERNGMPAKHVPYNSDIIFLFS